MEKDDTSHHLCDKDRESHGNAAADKFQQINFSQHATVRLNSYCEGAIGPIFSFF